MSGTGSSALSGTLVLAAIIGGSIIGSVAANTVPPTCRGDARRGGPGRAGHRVPTAPVAAAAPARIATTYRAAFAAALGVDVAALAPAAAKAAQAAIDAAVADGHLTAAQAERLKTRIADADAGACSKLVERIGQGPAGGRRRARRGRCGRRRRSA